MAGIPIGQTGVTGQTVPGKSIVKISSPDLKSSDEELCLFMVFVKYLQQISIS